jgi:hypothetical protein
MRRALPSLTIGGWNRLVATLGHVCASQLGHRGQGSDSAGGFPTLAAYLSSWAWSISQMHELHRDLWQFGWSDLRHLRVCGSAGRNQLDLQHHRSEARSAGIGSFKTTQLPVTDLTLTDAACGKSADPRAPA